MTGVLKRGCRRDGVELQARVDNVATSITLVKIFDSTSVHGVSFCLEHLTRAAAPLKSIASLRTALLSLGNNSWNTGLQLLFVFGDGEKHKAANGHKTNADYKTPFSDVGRKWSFCVDLEKHRRATLSWKRALSELRRVRRHQYPYRFALECEPIHLWITMSKMHKTHTFDKAVLLTIHRLRCRVTRTSTRKAPEAIVQSDVTPVKSPSHKRRVRTSC